MTSSTARIAVKLHKNVTLIRTTEPVLCRGTAGPQDLARWVVGGCRIRCFWSSRMRRMP